MGEVKLPQLADTKESAKVSKVRLVDLAERPPVLVDLGCVVEGFCQPHADPHDPMTTLAGVAKRFAIKPPPVDPTMLRKFKAFVARWIKKNMRALPQDSDTSVKTWLDSTSYPDHRKVELLEKWTRINGHLDPKKHYKVKSFMKDETYPEYKHARGINSRSDEFKCKVGPIFRLIEKELFAKKWFIKKIPVHLRPEYIMERLYTVGAKYVATDYTAFESLFVKEIMEACEFQLYDYMTAELPEHDQFMQVMHGVLAGENICDFKHFTVRLEATRMSGEMCTSLGNGFSNLMFMLFMAEHVGCRKVRGVVEGDDGLFSMIGTPPTSQDFSLLGLIIKMDIQDYIETASFCGLVFDTEDLINVTDPRDVLATFGWGSATYANSKTSKLKTLLRCKALSIAHQYPGCPILGELAQYALRVTRSHDTRKIIRHWKNTYEREQLLEAQANWKNARLYREPPLRTRLLVEKLYGISISQQLNIELYLRTKTDLGHLEAATISMVMPKVWGEYWNEYVLAESARRPMKTWIQNSSFQLRNPLIDTG